MVAETTADTDEQIIDLTELIEKGNVPTGDTSAESSRSAEADSIQEQLNALNDGKAAIEGDIDDLLAQMDMVEQAVPGGTVEDTSVPDTPDTMAATVPSGVETASAPSAEEHTVDPNEELAMPGMGDVDNLFNSLDIPPQPTANDQTSVKADQAVDAMLNDLTAGQSGSTVAQAAASDDNISEDGLASLLEAISGQSDTQKTSPSAKMASSDDLTADLDQLLEPVSSSVPSSQNVSKTPSAVDPLAEDIDALLAAAAAPEAAPAAAAQAPATETATASADDLEAMLAAATGQAAPAPETAAVAPQEVLSETAVPEQGPVATSAGDDLDALLAAAAAPEPAPAAEAQAPVTESVPAPSDAYSIEDLDAVFADAEQQSEAPEDITILQPKEETQRELTLQDDTPSENADVSVHAMEANVSKEAVSLQSMPLGDVEDAASMESAERSVGEPMNTGLVSSGLKAAQAQAVEATAQAVEASSQAVTAWEQAFEASSRAADAAEAVAALTTRLEQCEHALQEAELRIRSLENAVNEQAAAIVDASRQQTSQPSSEEILAPLFTEGNALHDRLMDCIARATRHVLEQTRPSEEPRVTRCEELLQEAGDRIIALENAVESQAETVQQLAGQAQENAMPDVAQVEAVLNERIQTAEIAARSTTARMDALEGRIDALEPRFNDRVEKAAAAAAARILREEIRRLLEQ